ncbi:MAG TPA: glycosyltransferase family 4 protein [Candidatus Binataceae bacterium]|nr:glycosyltransferase family 4 protein [Candidatus Binataceae bacterium]
MRIALLSRRFDASGGGTERDLIATAQCLRAAGHEITIFADEIRGTTDGWKVRRVGGPRIGRAIALLRFAYAAAPAARQSGADLVLSFGRTIGADIMRSGGGAHAAYLDAARKWRSGAGGLMMRLAPYHRAQLFTERRGFQWPGLKRAIAVSNFVRDDLVRRFDIAPAKAVTIYNGVDLENFRPRQGNDARGAIRAKFSIPASARVAVFVGNGFARKGLGFLIDAWAAIPGAPILLVAGADRKTESYAQRARQLGIGQRVVFAGPQPNIAEFFHAADALALPSLFEPFGNVVMEAMASGLPVLTSLYCGAAELLPPSMRPYCVEHPEDSGEIAVRMAALFDAPATLAGDARAAAEQFTWERYGRELSALIGSLKG